MNDYIEKYKTWRRAWWVMQATSWALLKAQDELENRGWASAPQGFYAFGEWKAMWEGRGPLVECSPWAIKERQDRVIENLQREVQRAARALNEAQRAYDDMKRRLEQQITAHEEMNR